MLDLVFRREDGSIEYLELNASIAFTFNTIRNPQNDGKVLLQCRTAAGHQFGVLVPETGMVYNLRAAIDHENAFIFDKVSVDEREKRNLLEASYYWNNDVNDVLLCGINFMTDFKAKGPSKEEGRGNE